MAEQATSTTASGMYLHRLEITDFMGVEHEAIELNGHHARITGGNASGKTSRLTALYAALAGVSVRDIPEPIRRGANKAKVSADLGEYKIELTITASGPRLVVTAADGSKIRRARDLLDGLLGEYSLDPSVFLDRRPQDQVDDVLAICGVRPPVDEVEQILGERIEPAESETADQYLMRLSADDTGLVYVRRRDAHRELDTRKGALQDAREHLETLGGPVAEGGAPPSTSDLMRRQQELTDQQQRRHAAHQVVERAKHRLDQINQQADTMHSDIVQAEKRCESIEEEIERLKRQLLEEQRALESKQAQLERVRNQSIPDAQRVLDDAITQRDAIPDAAEDLAEIRDQFEEVEEQREAIAARRQAEQSVQRLTEQVEAAKQHHIELDEQLGQLRALRRRILEDLDLGVPGLAVYGGELLLNGVPLRQCSTRERLQVAVAVATRQPGRIRLLRVDNAERFDQESWEYLLNEAGARGWQVVSAAVSDESGPPRVEVVERVAEPTAAGGAV